MWEKEKLTIVNPDHLPTVLHPANYSAKEVILTVLELNSQVFGFHVPYRDLKDAAEDNFCIDPRLIHKARRVVCALNDEASKKKDPPPTPDDSKEPVQ
jgi:hypothetical protein